MKEVWGAHVLWGGREGEIKREIERENIWGGKGKSVWGDGSLMRDLERKKSMRRKKRGDREKRE